jgi:hypothetical protein
VRKSRGERSAVQFSRGSAKVEENLVRSMTRNACVTSTLHGSDFGSSPYMRIEGRCVYVQ